MTRAVREASIRARGRDVLRSRVPTRVLNRRELRPMGAPCALIDRGEYWRMLTRLKVDGFKNLDRVDVRLGPFTCIAGPNGVGKSNLFDAILFLAALADKPLVEAALTVRGGDARRGDVRTLFRRAGGPIADRMKFVAELVIPGEGEDALGQTATA